MAAHSAVASLKYELAIICSSVLFCESVSLEHILCLMLSAGKGGHSSPLRWRWTGSSNLIPHCTSLPRWGRMSVLVAGISCHLNGFYLKELHSTSKIALFQLEKCFFIAFHPNQNITGNLIRRKRNADHRLKYSLTALHLETFLEISLFIGNWLTEILYVVINIPDWSLCDNQQR